MPYLGRPVTNAGQFEIIDDISSGFNGSETSFTLQVGGTDIQPDSANVTIVLDGVVQIPPTAYSITGSTLNFSEAPANGTGFHGVLAGQSQFIESGFITNTHISDSANISGSKINTDFSAQTVQAKIFSGMISSSAQISTDISGSLGSNAAIIRTLDRTTLSGSVTTVSSSLASRVTVNEGRVNQGVNTTDSPTFAGGTITGDFSVGGTITAQEVHTEFESASILFTSGSTKFGDTIDDTHQVTGSLLMTGSMAVGTGRGITPNGIFEVGLNTDGTRRFSVSFEDSLVSLSAKNQSNNGEVLKLMGDGLRIHTGTNTSGTEKMRIDSSGKVGIGTNNPRYPLVVSGSGQNSYIHFPQDNDSASDGLVVGFATEGNAYVYNYENSNLFFGTNNSVRMVVSSSGEVGIGTNIPNSIFPKGLGADNAAKSLSEKGVSTSKS